MHAFSYENALGVDATIETGLSLWQFYTVFVIQSVTLGVGGSKMAISA